MPMYLYESSTPRVALGLAAVALSTLTIAALVLVPAKVEDGSGEAAILAAARPITTVSDITVVEAPADYVAIHEQALAAAQCAAPAPMHGHRGARREETVAESLAGSSCPPTFRWR